MKNESTETFGCCGFHQECLVKEERLCAKELLKAVQELLCFVSESYQQDKGGKAMIVLGIAPILVVSKNFNGTYHKNAYILGRSAKGSHPSVLLGPQL